MPRSIAKAAVIDPTIYPESDGMGETTLHLLLAGLLREQLVRWFALRRRKVFVGSDQFIYWQQYNSQRTIAPDLYVLPGVAPTARPASWKTWETGIVPSFALEIVSRDVEKDYALAPPIYAEIGVEELVVFDPGYREGKDRVRWQVFRNVKGRGFSPVMVTNEDRIRSKALGCWLRSIGEGDQLWLRVAKGPRGETLLPTNEEDAERLRAIAAEQAKLAAEQAQLAAQERARADRIEAELLALRRSLGTTAVKPSKRGSKSKR